MKGSYRTYGWGSRGFFLYFSFRGRWRFWVIFWQLLELKLFGDKSQEREWNQWTVFVLKECWLLILKLLLSIKKREQHVAVSNSKSKRCAWYDHKGNLHRMNNFFSGKIHWMIRNSAQFPHKTSQFAMALQWAKKTHSVNEKKDRQREKQSNTASKIKELCVKSTFYVVNNFSYSNRLTWTQKIYISNDDLLAEISSVFTTYIYTYL